MNDPQRPAVLVELLTRPESLSSGEWGWRRRAGWFALALLGGAALYGAGAGFFAGGWQVLLAALKLPIVVAGALLLCLPSFVVIHLLAGVELPLRRLLLALAGLGALIGLLAAALMPIGWLFSVSSRSAGFLAFAHTVAWTVVALLGLRYLRAVLSPARGRAASVLWILLLWMVTLQLASWLGPVVHREAGQPAWELRRGFFVARWADPQAAEEP